jgi:hypothetical protein
MKKILLFIVVILFYSCKKENAAEQNSNSESLWDVEEYKGENETFLKTDTIYFQGKNEDKTNFILAHLLKQDIDKKTTLKTANFRLDFYKDDFKIQSEMIVFPNYEEGSVWVAYYDLEGYDSEKSLFIRLSFGYPACGYDQNNYLYYFEKNNYKLVHKWINNSDSGWGTCLQFSPSKNEATFYARTISFLPDENNEEMGIVEYSDSLKFERINEKWIKRQLTPKEKIYRTQKQSFDDFHKTAN